jgi:hypothetical protein
MKNLIYIFYFLLFFIFSLNAYSQLTLTSTYNPVIGDVEKYFLCDTVGVIQGDSGTNKTWNFSNLIVTDSSTNNYVNPVGTPYDSLFTLSNVASSTVSEGTMIYNYYKTSVNQDEFMGYAYQDFQEILSNTEIMMSYPFTYNSSYFDNVSGAGSLTGYLFNLNGTISNRGDATGTISLPFGTYPNALRVKTLTTETDSVPMFNLVYNFLSVGYSWYVGSLKFPVFSIYYNTTVQNGDTTYDKQVYYCHSQPIGIKQIGKNVPTSFELYQNFPNPFNPTTKIRFTIPSAGAYGNIPFRLVIYDVLGREVTTLVNEQLKPGSYEVEWNASNYPSGVYFYKLMAGDFSDTKRMVLIK